MKNLFYLLLFISCSVNISSQELSGRTYYSYQTNIRIEFTSTEMIWSEWQDEAAVYAETPFPYRIAIENQVVFIEYGESYSERFLALYTDRLLFLYDDDNSPPVFIGGENSRILNSITYSRFDWNASSYYENSNEEYPASNLANIQLFNPWVEGVDGNGVGESFSISNSAPPLFISNGFVSYQKPYLYEYNSRIKTIRITDLQSGGFVMIELEDTPNIQYLDIPDSLWNISDFEYQIIDVYPGDQWTDTSVNFLFFF
jgi:hypothetical protein